MSARMQRNHQCSHLLIDKQLPICLFRDMRAVSKYVQLLPDPAVVRAFAREGQYALWPSLANALTTAGSGSNFTYLHTARMPPRRQVGSSQRSSR
jgi:hypothetical protein